MALSSHCFKTLSPSSRELLALYSNKMGPGKCKALSDDFFLFAAAVSLEVYISALSIYLDTSASNRVFSRSTASTGTNYLQLVIMQKWWSFASSTTRSCIWKANFVFLGPLLHRVATFGGNTIFLSNCSFTARTRTIWSNCWPAPAAAARLLQQRYGYITASHYLPWPRLCWPVGSLHRWIDWVSFKITMTLTK